MKKLIYLSLILLIPIISDAQRWKHERLSAFIGLGSSYFLGDLGGGAKDASHYLSFRDIDWQLTRPAYQVGVRYRILQDLSVKPTVTYARLKADDLLSGSIGRMARNLHFRTDIWEFGAQFEYYFIKEKQVGRYTFSSFRGINRISAYASLGGGAFLFNPKSEANRGDNIWVELRPMENEGIAYGKVAAYMSIGLGMKINITDRWAIGIDVSNRYTTTDFIDDAHDMYSGKNNGFDDRHFEFDPELEVITGEGIPFAAGTKYRGNPSYNDAYLFTMITGYYKITSVFSMPKY